MNSYGVYSEGRCFSLHGLLRFISAVTALSAEWYFIIWMNCSVCIHSLIGICYVFCVGLLWVKLLGIFYTSLFEGHMFLFLLGKCPRIVGAVFFFFLERKKKKLSESERNDSFGEGACHEACRPELHSILWHMWGPSISELKMLERPARLSP